MEMTNSYMTNYYAASTYMTASSALSNAYQLAGSSNSTASSSAAASFQTNPDSMPSRRLDRSDPASPNLSINVYGRDGRTVSGVVERPDVMLGNNPILPSEFSAEGLPYQPEQLFSQLANGLSEQNGQTISQIMEELHRFSNQLSSDALNMKDTLRTVWKDSLLATKENIQDRHVSDETANRLTDATSRFVDRYNTTMETLVNSPNQSRQAASLERAMESAVTDNSEELDQIGITQNNDGTLAFDEDRFRQVLSENPQAVRNIFNQESDMAQEINRTMDVAENTRVMRNAELSSVLPAAQPFSYYPAAVQSSSVVSMAHVPPGYLLNRLA